MCKTRESNQISSSGVPSGWERGLRAGLACCGAAAQYLRRCSLLPPHNRISQNNSYTVTVAAVLAGTCKKLWPDQHANKIWYRQTATTIFSTTVCNTDEKNIYGISMNTADGLWLLWRQTPWVQTVTTRLLLHSWRRLPGVSMTASRFLTTDRVTSSLGWYLQNIMPRLDSLNYTVELFLNKNRKSMFEKETL